MHGFSYESALGLGPQILKVLSQKQQLASHNIANASTPGYTAQRMDFAQVMARLSDPMMNQLGREMGHITPGVDVYDSGQPVNLHEEFLEMQKGMTNYSMATRLISSTIAALRQASQVGR